MKLMFIGADHEVTGSCHYVEAAGKRFIVDYGMEQGGNRYENVKIPVSPGKIDYVFLTHAHIDHSGLLPLLYANGFRGKIFATKATSDLCQIMLKDSAHIQEMEAEWRNRKAIRSGKQEVEPLYTMEDAINVLEKFVPCSYAEKLNITTGIDIRFTDIGHLLGSSSIEIWLEESSVERKLVFSGDIGNYNQPLIKDPQYTKDADYVIMESTYGDRYHGSHPDYVGDLAKVIQKTFDRKGNVIIPSFAVGRTQELLYYIRQIKDEERVKNHGDFQVIVDSPLAVEATNIFHMDVEQTYDEEAMELVRKGINPITFSNLHLSVTTEESKAINFDPEPKVIISASGMCDAGRIRHHLKHNLWDSKNTVVFVGYQANGTLGRSLSEGAKEVRLFGETIQVNAEILKLEGLSGHADKKGLLRWIQEFEIKPKHVFVVHGEDSVATVFAECLKTDEKLEATAPYSGDAFDLIDDKFIAWGSRELIKDRKKHPESGAYIRLKSAVERLQAVVEHNEGGANKDLAKLTDQILALCEKWDR